MARARPRLSHFSVACPAGAVTSARERLEALDRWLDAQAAKEIPLSVHALLTHVVDEAGTACQELQQGVEGATDRTAAIQREVAQ